MLQKTFDTVSLCRYLRLEDLLEDVLEAAVVSLQDGVLGAEVERPALVEGVLHAALSKPLDGLQYITTTMTTTIKQIITH